MPTYDPTFRGALNRVSSGGSSSVSFGSTTTHAGDLILVTALVGTSPQINPPDGTWHRINGLVSGYQAFWHVFEGGTPTWIFTWDGTNQPYVFNQYSFYSAGGGAISFGAAITSFANPALTKTSDPITPSENALVLVDFIEFVDAQLSPVSSPFTPALSGPQGGGAGGYEYVTGGAVSDTWTEPNADSPHARPWVSGTFTLLSSLVNVGQPPLLSDEAIFQPLTNAKSDILFRSCSGATAFPFFTGSVLNPARPAGVQPGDLLIAHIWSNGTAPGVGSFQAIPVGWTLLPGSYKENFASTPAASWIFYKVATAGEADISSYGWILPRPTLNIWTAVVYAFVHTAPVNFFNGFLAATGGDGSPRAPGLTPDWRNDVSLLLFAEIDPPIVQVPPWPVGFVGLPGYLLLCERENQGTWQVGYLGTPNSCDPVPDEFAYTEAQQITQMGSVRFRTAWFAYSFLLKNINVVGQSCAVPPPPPPPPFPPPPPPPPPPVTAAFCPLGGSLIGIPLEIQTPAQLLDEGRFAICSRFFIDIDTGGEDLFLTILVDEMELPYPFPINSTGRTTIEVAFQVSGMEYSVRLSACLSFGQVELFEVWTDLDLGKPPVAPQLSS